MGTTLTQAQAITQLERFMARRGLALYPSSEARLARYDTETVQRLSQILVTEGKFNFVGECSIMDIQITACKPDAE